MSRRSFDSDSHVFGRCVLANEVDDGLELGRPLRNGAKRRARGLGAGSPWSIAWASVRVGGIAILNDAMSVVPGSECVAAPTIVATLMRYAI